MSPVGAGVGVLAWITRRGVGRARFLLLASVLLGGAAWLYHIKTQRQQEDESRRITALTAAGCSVSDHHNTVAVVLTSDCQAHTLAWFRLLPLLLSRCTCPKRVHVFVGGDDVTVDLLKGTPESTLSRVGQVVVVESGSEHQLASRLVGDRFQFVLLLRAPTVMADNWDTTLVATLQHPALELSGGCITSWGASPRGPTPDFFVVDENGHLGARAMRHAPTRPLPHSTSNVTGIPIVATRATRVIAAIAGASHPPTFSPMATLGYVEARFRPRALLALCREMKTVMAHDDWAQLRIGVSSLDDGKEEAYSKYGSEYTRIKETMYARYKVAG